MLIPYASAETLAQMAEGVAGYRAAFVGAGGLPEAATVPFGLHLHCAVFVAASVDVRGT